MPATDVEVLSETQIVATAPAHVKGRVDVVVTQYGLDILFENAFTYISPLTITSVTPDRGPIDGGTTVVIDGRSFVPIGSTAATAFANLSVDFGGSTCVVATVADYSDTMIKCRTSAHAAGVVDITISTSSDPNHSGVYPGVLDSSTGEVSSGYLYVVSEISMSAPSVSIPLAPQTTGADSSLLYVRTDNPAGYSVKIKADDGDSATTNDNWLKCTESQTDDRFVPVAMNSVLTDNTWGWGIGNTMPESWRPVPTVDTEMISPVRHPTGPDMDGALPDIYTLWFGARAGTSQTACGYHATVMISVVTED